MKLLQHSLVAVLVLAVAAQPGRLLASVTTFGAGPNQFTMEFVPVGDAGNAADSLGDPAPIGAVAYDYDIGKYEVTRDMVDKVNNAAPLGVTMEDMSSLDPGGNGPNRPASGITWIEAARFVNWLNTTSGYQPAYKFAVQPTDPGYNIYQSVELWTPGDVGYSAANTLRNSQAKYFVSSSDEWYKAAYFDPTTSVYHEYPTGSDLTPDGIDFVGDTAFDAVFDDGGFAFYPHDVTNAGVASPYGTIAQGGNVWEVMETEYARDGDPTTDREIRAGGYLGNGGGEYTLQRDVRYFGGIGDQVYGFRVVAVAVPEASSLVACAAAAIAAWACRVRGARVAPVL